MKASKSNPGRHFEDFQAGMVIHHATPRTVNDGDKALNNAIYPFRHALYSSDVFARRCGLPCAPLEEFALFHFVFGKSVPDVSVNAVANLGYAEMRFNSFACSGDTLSARSVVIGTRETSNRKSGIVWVRTEGFNQHGESVVEFVRWVMVRKRLPDEGSFEPVVPSTNPAVVPEELPVPVGLDYSNFDFDASGESYRWSDYEIGETIDHRLGVTVEEAEHMMATRLWQNPARIHFDAALRGDGKRLIYGGHVISLARALSFYGLANAQPVVAVNGGRHVSPCHAGMTVHAWSRVIGKAACRVPGAGALRIQTVATSGHLAAFPEDSTSSPVLLDLDYWVLIPL